MSDIREYTVYVHICPNGKRYVGITKQKPNRRWRNGNGYKSNDYFNKAINKYGWDNIEHFIMCSNLTRQEALDFEVTLIHNLQSNDRRYGYNLTDGGDGVTGSKCPQWRKDALSKSMSGKGNHMYGISLEGMKGEDNPMYGKPAINRRMVECVTTDKKFDAVSHGAKYYGTHSADISKVCKGKRSYAGTLDGIPLVWRYIS